jgi:hypothetical protein
MSDFLPDNFQLPATGSSRYVKLPQGETRLRVLGSPLMGYVAWTEADGKRLPVRVPRKEELPQALQGEAKYFWALPVWSYAQNQVMIWEATQRRIITALLDYAHNPDWGSPVAYDVSVTRKGEGMETEYSVIAIPPKPLIKEAQDAWEQAQADGFDLSELYRNGDPFAARATDLTDEITMEDLGDTFLPAANE